MPLQTIDIMKIQPHMPVVAANGEQLGIVDHIDVGNTIKLTKDTSGMHHWIPQSWVSQVDDQVHVDRPGKQVKQEWSSEAPQDVATASRR